MNTPADLQRRIVELEAELKEERRLNRRLTERVLAVIGDKAAATGIGKAADGQE